MMVSLGGFPGLIPSDENHNIVIEIYEVTDSTYRNVERLESYPSFYQKAKIDTTEGNIEIYILENPEYKSYPEVKNGDWVEYNKKIEYADI